MSRQSKNTRNRELAKKFTQMHKNGEKGPERTKPMHNKVNCWWKKYSSYSAFCRGEKKRNVEAS